MSSPSSPLTPPDVALADVESESQFSGWVDDRTVLNTVLEGYQYPPGDDTAFFLRTFFHYLPEREGQHNLVSDVQNAAQTGELLKLRNYLEAALLRSLLAHGGQTPVPITPSPCPGAQDELEHLASHNTETATRSPQGQLKENCQQRDGHRCVVTGIWHREHRPNQQDFTGELEAAYIIPFTVSSFRTPVERQEVEKIWDTLFQYFPALRSRVGLAIADVNCEDNIMTMFQPLHSEFSRFRIIFEWVGPGDRYNYKTFRDFHNTITPFLPRDGFFTLHSYDSRFPLPHRNLLAMHAAIGNILHATGAGERIEKILQDLEGASDGLAPDGSTKISRLLSVSRLSLLSSDWTQPQSPKESPQKPKPAKPAVNLPGTENQRPRWGC
jgi:hypothetical protein